MGLESGAFLGRELERFWKGIGKARGVDGFPGGSHSAAQGLFHDALSEGVVARCLLQVVDKLRGAMLFVCYCGAGQGVVSAVGAVSAFAGSLLLGK